MYKLVALSAMAVCLAFGISGCKPGVYYPLGGSPQAGKYYIPAPGQPGAQPSSQPASAKTSWVVAS